MRGSALLQSWQMTLGSNRWAEGLDALPPDPEPPLPKGRRRRKDDIPIWKSESHLRIGMGKSIAGP